MLIFIGTVLTILVYGIYRCWRERSLSYFRLVWGMMVHTAFKGNKSISVILWLTLSCSLVLSNWLGAKNVNLSPFNPISHFMFGFLARELLKISNDYYPYIDKLATRFPERMRRHVNPTTLAFLLCMGNGVQEEIQKFVPKLKTLVWTNLRDQVSDAVMDTGGILLSAYRLRISRALRKQEVEGVQRGI